jgi:hypothetical protein
MNLHFNLILIKFKFYGNHDPAGRAPVLPFKLEFTTANTGRIHVQMQNKGQLFRFHTV